MIITENLKIWSPVGGAERGGCGTLRKWGLAGGGVSLGLDLKVQNLVPLLALALCFPCCPSCPVSPECCHAFPGITDSTSVSVSQHKFKAIISLRTLTFSCIPSAVLKSAGFHSRCQPPSSTFLFGHFLLLRLTTKAQLSKVWKAVIQSPLWLT